MGMKHQAAVRVLGEAMMYFTGQICRIDVQGNVRKIRQAVQQLMSGFNCNRVTLGDGQVWTHGKINLGVQSMARPAQADFSYVVYAMSVSQRVTDFIGHGRIDSVQQSGKYRFPRLPHDR